MFVIVISGIDKYIHVTTLIQTENKIRLPEIVQIRN